MQNTDEHEDSPSKGILLLCTIEQQTVVQHLIEKLAVSLSSNKKNVTEVNCMILTDVYYASIIVIHYHVDSTIRTSFSTVFLITVIVVHHQFAEILGDINQTLADPTAIEEGMGSHGMMLGLQLLKEHRSSRGFLEAMVAKYNDFYRDFDCLRPLHDELRAKVYNRLQVCYTIETNIKHCSLIIRTWQIGCVPRTAFP